MRWPDPDGLVESWTKAGQPMPEVEWRGDHEVDLEIALALLHEFGRRRRRELAALLVLLVLALGTGIAVLVSEVSRREGAPREPQIHRVVIDHRCPTCGAAAK